MAAPSRVSGWPWPDYSYQSLRDFASSRKLASEIDQLYFLHPILYTRFPSDNNLTWQDLLLAAFVKLSYLYIDSSDFIFAELRKDTAPSCWRASLDPRFTWSELALCLRDADRHPINMSEARAALGINVTQNPFPVAIAWDTQISDSNVLGALVLRVAPLNNGSAFIGFRWDHAFISPSTVQTFSKQLLSLLDLVLSDRLSLASSPLSFDRQLMSAHDATYNPNEAHCVTEWLSDNAKRRPNAIAHEIYADLQAPPQLVTYREFNEQANKLARWLLDNGLKLEDRVVVCRTRDFQFHVAHAAIFKAGGCYVSIDPELPDERKLHIVSDSGARFVLTSPSCLPIFPGFAYSLDSQEFADQVTLKDASDIALARLDSLAYLLYTSGTTGKPKGCLLNHRGLYWAIRAMSDYPRDVTNSNTDKRLAMASIAFDVHISEICQTWCLGTRLVSAPRFELLSSLRENIIRLGITHLAMVPSMIQATLSSPKDLPLKYMVSGGEKISDFVLENWAGYSKLILANFYGPTEATIGCASRKVTPNDKKDNIGIPFTCCSAYIVDSNMNIVPRGVAGELVVEGPLVGRGYHNLPEMTAMSFIEWPRRGCRAYRTGDFVRMTSDGTLQILGRIDSQIKLRGVRIESDGISEVIRKAAPDQVVVHTLVAAHPDLGSETLVSFLARDDVSVRLDKKRTSTPKIMRDSSDSHSAIRDPVKKELATYMRPAHILLVDFLPLTLNGKIDGKKLASVFTSMSLPDLMALQSGGQRQEATKLESAIIAIASRVCGVEEAEMGPSTNLFECGFDSLKFAAFARMLRDDIPAPAIAVADIMANPVVEDIAYRCQEDAAVPSDDSWLETFDQLHRSTVEGMFKPEDVVCILPTLPIQDGVLAQSIWSKDLYVQHFLYRTKEHVDLKRVKEAWKTVVSRQDILRTCFILDPDSLQVVLSQDAADIPWTVHGIHSDVDFAAWFSEAEAARIAHEINEDITSPLYQLNIYRSRDAINLAVSAHHAVYDGIAFPQLMQEVDAAYNGAKLPRPIHLRRIVKELKSPISMEKSREFWVSELKGIDLNTNRPVFADRTRTSRLTKEMRVSLQDLQDRCSAMHVTLEALFATTFALKGRSLFGWSQDAVFGIIRSGRMGQADYFNKAICPLVSVVPLRLHIQQGNMEELVRSCQNKIVKIIPHEHTPLGTIQRWLGVTDLVDVVFSCRIETGSNEYQCFEHIPLSPPASEFSFAMEVVLNHVTDMVELRVSFVHDEGWMDSVSRFVECFEDSVILTTDSSNVISLVDNEYHVTVPAPKDEKIPDLVDVDPTILETVRTELGASLRVDLENIRDETSLISLGLDSLKAIGISRRLRERGVNILSVDIIRTGSVRELAAKASSDSQLQFEPDSTFLKREMELLQDLDLGRLKLDDGDEVRVLFTTPLQAGMLSQTIASSGQLYVHSFQFELFPSCDLKRLQDAWKQAIVELDILRTSFHFSPALGSWAQVVHSFSELKWSHEKHGSIGDAVRDFTRRLPFNQDDAFHQPPVYFLQVTCDTEYLVVVLHHALYDGASLPWLLQLVRKFYNGNTDDSAPHHQFWTLSREIVASEASANEYWISRLRGLNPCLLPRSTTSSVKAWRSTRRLSVPLSSIQRFRRRYQVGPQAIAQAVWAKILAARLQSLDVAFGHVVSGRTFRDSENVIGPVFNTVPCRVILKRRQTWKELARSVHRSNVDAIHFQHASLRSIQKALDVNVLCDTLFLFQPEEHHTSENHFWRLVSESDDMQAKSQYAVNVEVHQDGDCWTVKASCAADALSLADLNLILDEYDSTLLTLVSRSGDQVLSPDFQPVEKPIAEGITEMAGTEKDTEVGSEIKWSKNATLLLDILSRFTKIPEEKILYSSSLASMGLDSISALQISALAKRVDLTLTAPEIIKSTTVGDLIKSLSYSTPVSFSSVKMEIESPLADVILTSLPRSLRHLVQFIYPASPGMEWIIGAWQRSGGCRFQHAFIRKLKGPMNTSRMQEAWTALMRKHPILRATFVPVLRSPSIRLALCILDQKPQSIACKKLPHGVEEVDEVRQEARMSVNSPPLVPGIHSRLTVLEGKDTFLVINLHHFQYDAASLPILFRDLEALYFGNEFSVNTDLNTHLGQMISSPQMMAEQETYWKSVFPMGWRPTFLSSNLHEKQGRWTKCVFPGVGKSLKALQVRAQKADLNLHTILLACWAKLQARLCSSSEATFGLWQSGRSGIDTSDNLALPCLNFLPIRVEGADQNILDSARCLSKDLQRRSGIVEKSRISDVSAWVGHPGKPLCNVYVNLLYLPPVAGNSDRNLLKKAGRMFEPVNLPNGTPDPGSEASNGWKNTFTVPEVQDDCIIEIFFDRSQDSIGIAIECESCFFGDDEANKLAHDWRIIVNEAFA